MDIEYPRILSKTFKPDSKHNPSKSIEISLTKKQIHIIKIEMI